jgi:curved DNA-binding protein
MEKDLYKILGVDENATQKEIKNRYKVLASKYHPDKNKDKNLDEDYFKNISAAYDVHKDPEKRKEYDQMRMNPHSAFGQYGTGNGFSGDLSDLIQNIFFGGQGSGPSFFGGGFDDPFSGFAGKKGYQQPATPQTASLKIALSTALHGGKINVTTPAGRTISLSIKAGTYHGQNIRLKGQGQNQTDLVLTIELSNDDRYYLDGDNLVIRQDIDFKTAIAGGKIDVLLPENKKIRLAIPAFTNSGKRFKIQNSATISRHFGNHSFIEILPHFPSQLSAEEKQKYLNFAADLA